MHTPNLLIFLSVALGALTVTAVPNSTPFEVVQPAPRWAIAQLRRSPIPRGGGGSKGGGGGKSGGGGKQYKDGIGPSDYRWDVRIVGHDHSAHWHSCDDTCKKAKPGKGKECLDNCHRCAANLESEGNCGAMGVGRGDMGMSSMLCSVVTDHINSGPCGNGAYNDAMRNGG